MSSGNAALETHDASTGRPVDERPAAILRGNARGLEIVVDGRAAVDAVIAAATARLAEAPAFFKGSDVRIRVEDGPLPPGSLGRFDELAIQFELRIVEVAAASSGKKGKVAVADEAVPQPNLGGGSAPEQFAAGSAPTPAGAAVAPPLPPIPSPGSRGSSPGIDVPKAFISASAATAAVATAPVADLAREFVPNSVVMATAAALAPALGDRRFSAALAAASQGLPWAPANDLSPSATEPLQPDLPMPIGKLEAPVPSEQMPVLPTVDLPPRDQLELALRSLDESARMTEASEAVRPSRARDRIETEPGEPLLDDEPFERAKTERGLEDEPPFERARTHREVPRPKPSREAPSTPERETRLFVGPVRSGVILDHRGHLFVFGDVNPGAEVRATGNIVVLGRLRGTAHAGIGAAAGFIVALRLEPQQLRIGRLVARASDGETASLPEIAYVTNGAIVVERYQGRLPNGLSATLSPST